MPPVIASFGRGSPTGVACYRHTQFPEEYHGAVFALDWTFGRVWALPLQRTGETYRTKPIEFLTARGQYGFAPTDADIGPDGSLYVSVGGRGTRGGVFRVRAANAETKAPGPLPKEPTARLHAVLDAPQPLSSWSRARWEPAARELHEEAFVQAALDESLSGPQRVRAIEILTDLFSGIGEDQVEKLIRASHPEVRARLAWAIERVPVKIDPTLTAKLIGDPDPLVKRRILEAVAMHPQFALPAPSGTFLPVLGDRHKFVRTAAARALGALNEDTFDMIGAEVRKADWRAALTYAWGRNIRRGATEPKLDAYAIELGRLILEGRHAVELKRDAARLIQIGLGDMGSTGKAIAAYDGYSSPLDLSKYERELDPLRIALGKLYPSGDRDLDIELSRLVAMLSPLNPELLTHVLAKITDASDPVDDIHQLLVASRIPVQRSNPQQAAIAHALVQIEPKIVARKMGQDTNWEARFGELYEQLVELDAELPEKIVKDPEFGRPGHVLFLTRAPSELIPDAVAAYSKRVAADPDFAWNNDVVFLFGMIDAAAYRKLVRDQYDRFAVRSSVVITLAERPEPQDRPKFVEGLDSSQMEVLTACLGALEKLPAESEADENVALVRTLRRLGTDAAEYPVRERVVKLLKRNSGKSIDFIFGEAGHKPQPEAVKAWTAWALENFPAKAAELQGGSEADLQMLRKLLDSTDWNKGDAARGRRVFDARGCIQCHGGSRALGPD
ncbi:MAG TPA: hypothetical protein VHB77_20855, partial [Planctomycetaceae bacterium]|nr:hypothetical protein [Planctomycetaceae bacterium]